VSRSADRISGPVEPFRFVVEDRSSFETDAYTASFEAPRQ
jgi:hypothetical protein